jgi:hypothetical protein
MWGVLVGFYIVVIIYPFIEEWQQKHADKSALANMRRHSGLARASLGRDQRSMDGQVAERSHLWGKRKGRARLPGPYATRTPLGSDRFVAKTILQEGITLLMPPIMLT